MSLFAIADLHLSFYKIKDNIFGDNWLHHYEKIKKNWINNINCDDTVLILGDISWAKNLKELEPDMLFINNLPGKKIFLKGNHDYWWGSITKLKELYKDIFFMQNNFTVYKDTAICGSRGWVCPNDNFFTKDDKKIYMRELNRLKISLEMAVKSGYSKIYVVLHFPPTNCKKENSDFIDLIENYPVKKVIYGHLHGKDCFDFSYKGVVNNIEYILVSSDYIDFDPYKIE